MLLAGVACRGGLQAPRQSLLLLKAHRGRRGIVRSSLAVNNKIVLVPIGDGSCDHLEESIPLPDAIELSEGLFEIGRDVPADVILRVPTVSTRHAMIRIAGDQVQVTDLSSTNGTYVGEQQLTPMKSTDVPVGSEITFGDMYLAKFKVEQVPEPVLDTTATAVEV